MQWRSLLSALAAILALAGCADDDITRPTSAESMAAREDALPDFIRLREVGDPTWEPVDFHLFTAPLGTPESGFAEFGELVEALWPAPEHIPISPALGIGPGAPHGPPYRRELAKAVKANGLVDRDVFPAVAFSARSGNAVYLAGTLIPRARARGRSPDFDAGWIIPNRVMPITVSGISQRNGESFDPFLAPETDIPALDEDLAPQFGDLDGHSHIPFITGDNQLFGPPGTPVQGFYRYQITMRDRTGSGWNIVARFRVRQNR
jgi:hypothetical protein